ncbi:hypothetical protein JMJ35_010578 [Cladonia borealis]|uniref:non-specific serine/threonine protein kinase n=1 Tax=Cladonia borealis TaxID=184061 RepID=A0AA39UWX9_9LECA|nr:hypothetical protein JMJ35_010578 [Cladonia borealis]
MAAQANNAFYCEVYAEPLERYQEGGYHPTHLGDYFKEERYKIIHKLGWRGYATVWLAKDLILSRHTALKILVSERSQDDHEAQILNHQFYHEGPNGSHLCLVFKPLGPSVFSKTESYKSNRLLGEISWEASKQIVQGLEYIHARGIVHGDLHTGNVLRKPQTGDVLATYRAPLTPRVPRYLVHPTLLRSPTRDIGDALIFRAPETIFTFQKNLQTDIWSLACTIFELIVGYPPFDNYMPNRDDLIREWVSMLGDLPQEWAEYLPPPQANGDLGIERCSLAEWLHQTYFDDEKTICFTKAEIQAAGDLLQSMLQYRPSNRPRASELLEHRWFRDSRFGVQEARNFNASSS